jgi:uncharacterized membrane protein SirB2
VELYPLLKQIHVACVILTIGGFALRGLWMLLDSPLLRHRLTRVLPHVNDTLLLGSGIGLAVLLRQYPLVDGWLTAKLLALLAYIVLGSVALKRGRTPGVRAAALVAALLTVGYLVAVAMTRNPWPPFPGVHDPPQSAARRLP